jgi:amino acid transporter
LALDRYEGLGFPPKKLVNHIRVRVNRSISLQRSLKTGALSFLDTLTMAIAGSASAYSVTVSTAALVTAAGVAGPAALWIAALPIMGIAVAFAYLNRWRPDAGAVYAWVGRAMHPALGFLAGWALLSLSTIFNVAAALPAGQATLELFAPGRSHDVVWAAGAGAVWFLGVLAIVTFGIKVSAKAQVGDLQRSRHAGRRFLLGLVFAFGFRVVPIIFGRNAGRAFLLFRLGRIREPRGRNG